MVLEPPLPKWARIGSCYIISRNELPRALLLLLLLWFPSRNKSSQEALKSTDSGVYSGARLFQCLIWRVYNFVEIKILPSKVIFDTSSICIPVVYLTSSDRLTTICSVNVQSFSTLG